jgi:hypothetical protein
MVAVHNVVAASATVGLIGREGELIRRTSIPMLVYSLGAGAMAFIGLNGLGINAGTVVLTALIVGLAVVVVMIRRSPGKPLPGLEAGVSDLRPPTPTTNRSPPPAPDSASPHTDVSSRWIRLDFHRDFEVDPPAGANNRLGMCKGIREVGTPCRARWVVAERSGGPSLRLPKAAHSKTSELANCERSALHHYIQSQRGAAVRIARGQPGYANRFDLGPCSDGFQ